MEWAIWKIHGGGDIYTYYYVAALVMITSSDQLTTHKITKASFFFFFRWLVVFNGAGLFPAAWLGVLGFRVPNRGKQQIAIEKGELLIVLSHCCITSVLELKVGKNEGFKIL